MSRSRPNLPALIGAGAAVLFGLSIVVVAGSYRLGTLLAMGPGFFPVLAGIALIVFGVCILVFERNVEMPVATAVPWRGIITIGGAILSFALLTERLGFVPAVFCAAFISGLADREFSLRHALVLASALTIGTWAIFGYGLGLQFEAFR
jgi:hypothetical protein